MITAIIEPSVDTHDFLGNRRMAKESGGRLWSIYRDRDNGTYDIKVAYSDDGGATWTDETVDSGLTASAQCALAIDSNDTIHALWCDRQLVPTWEVWLWYRTRTSAGVWSGVTVVYNDALNFSASVEPDIAIDGDDNVHVAWVELIGNRFIKYRKRTIGVGWGAIEDAATNGIDDHIETPSIAIDSTNYPHIAYHKDTPLNRFNIFYVFRTVAGWQPEENVTNGVGGADDNEYPQIALDNSDNVHVAWMGYNRGVNVGSAQIVYRKRTVGVGWGVEELLTDIAATQGYGLSISLNTNDMIHVVWSGIGWGVNVGEYAIQHRQSSAVGVWSTQDDLVNEAKYNYLATSLWARYPSNNILSDGYMFIYVSENGISDLEFYATEIPRGGSIPGVLQLLT